MTKADLIEALAAIEHERWADWQNYLHDCCRIYADGSLVIPAEKATHWERLISTAYADLPEHSKQADRDQVARYLPLIVEFVAAYFESFPADYDALSAAQHWRQEMAGNG